MLLLLAAASVASNGPRFPQCRRAEWRACVRFTGKPGIDSVKGVCVVCEVLIGGGVSRGPFRFLSGINNVAITGYPFHVLSSTTLAPLEQAEVHTVRKPTFPRVSRPAHTREIRRVLVASMDFRVQLTLDENRRIRVVYSRTHARKFQVYGHFQVCATRTLAVCRPAHGPDMNHSGVRAMYRPAHATRKSLHTPGYVALTKQLAPTESNKQHIMHPTGLWYCVSLRTAASERPCAGENIPHGRHILCLSTALSRDTADSQEGCTSYLRRVTCAGPDIPVHTTNYQVSGRVRRYHRPAHAVADISCTHPDTPGHTKFHGTCPGAWTQN
ncbi:hypothetical protein Bbelb_116610 [Branchiostoma belcheri]|nr:hypothetical protein Bbelb_116610 [Branchiostoma belcheri]